MRAPSLKRAPDQIRYGCRNRIVILEVETKTTIEQGLVMEVITLLDTVSIAL